MGFLTKKRKGKFWAFTNWIVESPVAMSVLMFIQPITTFLLMTSAFIYFVVSGRSGLLTFIFFIFASFMAIKSYHVITLAVKLGGVTKLCDVSANELVWGKKNDKPKDNEQFTGCSGTVYQGDDTETGRDNRPSKRSHPSFSELVDSNKKDS